MDRKWDMTLEMTAGGQIVKTVSRGFFEHMNELAIGEGDTDYIEIGNFRLWRREYEANKDKFDKALTKIAAKNPYAAQERYDAENVRMFTLKFNRKTDADLIAYLEAAPSIQGAVKDALRVAIETQKSE